MFGQLLFLPINRFVQVLCFVKLVPRQLTVEADGFVTLTAEKLQLLVIVNLAEVFDERSRFGLVVLFDVKVFFCRADTPPEGSEVGSRQDGQEKEPSG